MRLAVLAAVLLCALTGCASATPSPEAPAEFVLSSPDLDADGYLPEWAVGNAEGFCDGENRSPQLDWSGAPDGTKAFAITMTDPNYTPYIHWVVTGLGADVDSVASSPDGQIAGAVLGASGEGAGAPGTYVGPCVVDNGYLYTVYALDEEIEGAADTTLLDFVDLTMDHVLATAELEIKRH